MPAPFTNNPLYVRLTQNARGPSLRTTIWLTGVLAVISLTVAVVSLATLRLVEANAAQLTSAEWHIMIDANVKTLWVLQGLFLVGPLGMGVISALHTGSDMPSKGYGLSNVPSLTDAQVVRGYVYAGLYRMRLLLVLVVGFAPIMIGGLVYFTLNSLILMHPVSSFPFWRISEPYHLTFLDVIGTLTTISVASIGFLALNPLAAVLGTALVLQRGKTGTTCFLTAIIILLGGAFGVIVLLTLIGPTVGGAPFSQYSTVLQVMGVTVGLCIGPPILLTLGVMALAGWWAQTKEDGYEQQPPL